MTQLESHHGYYLWRYVPSIAAAVIFCLLFGAAAIAQSWRLYKTRAWFCIAFAIGGLFEFIGYAARIAAHSKTGNLMPYIIQNVFILLGPALFAASIYMTLSRIIRAVGGEKHSILRPSLLTKTFVLGDVLSFFVQGGAAGLMVTGNNVKMGERIIVVGLFIQIVTFGLFAVTAGIFEYRLRWDPTNESLHAVAWKRSLHMLYGVSVLIMVRSIFRAIEYIAGQNGYLLNHEWTLFVFDSIPMFIVVVTFYVWYPSDIQPRQGLGSQGLEQDMEMNS